MSIISLGHVNTAAVRSLLGCRGISAVGLTINDSVAQEATVTVGGVKHDGDVVTVTLNGTAFSHTTVGGNADLAAVATALAAVIDANAAYVSTATAEVITITAADAAAGFIASVAVTGADATTTLTLANTHLSVQSVETDNACAFLMDGHCGTKAATADIAVGGAVLPVSSFRWYLVTVDGDGNMVTHPGVDNKAELADIPDHTAPIGAFKVVTDATHTFTPGVTALNATGITTTFFDLSCVPKAGVPA